MDGAIQQQEEPQQPAEIKQRDWELAEMDNEALVRTIRVTSWASRYDIDCPTLSLAYECFQQFGEVESIRLDYNENECVEVGFIQFKEASTAANLILKRRIEFDHGHIDIKPIEAHHLIHNEDIVPFFQPADEESPKHILNALNDDCLHEILKKLNFSGLCSVANVCKMFNQIAKKVFAYKYRYETIESKHLQSIGFPTLLRAEEFLNNFGSLITSLRVDAITFDTNSDDDSDGNSEYNLSNSILTMVSTHCINLDKLHIDFEVNDRTLIQISSLLSRLKTVELAPQPYCTVKDLISKCSQLEVLEFNYGYTIDLADITFPNLKRLYIYGVSIDSTSIFKTIAHNLPKLQDLTLVAIKFINDNLQPDIEYVSQLKCLKRLEIQFTNIDVLSLLQALSSNHISIKYLVLDGISRFTSYTIDLNMINSICQLKSITALSFRNLKNITDVYFIRLAKQLPNLKTFVLSDDIELSVFETGTSMLKEMLRYANQLLEFDISVKNIENYPFDEIDYNSILSVIKNRKSRNKLMIYISSVFNIFNIHEDVRRSTNKFVLLNKHPDWLTISKTYTYYTQTRNQEIP